MTAWSDLTDDERAALRAEVAAERVAQGLPPTITEAQRQQVAAIFAAAEPRDEKRPA